MSVLFFLNRRRKQRDNKKKRTQSYLNRFLISAGIFLVVLFGGLIISGSLAYASITADLPSPDLMPVLLNPENGSLLQPTRIYDRTGTHLLMSLSPSEGARTYLRYQVGTDGLPENLVNATVAAADPEFWLHSGYSLVDWANPDQHSTLAQKLVSDLLLWDEPPSLRRAIRERLLAAQITARFGREKVLEWYLNSANYAYYAYGAEAAARMYFGKSAAQLNLAEAALLAAVNLTPNVNPLDSPEVVWQRQAEVLNLMQSRGFISSGDVLRVRQTRVTFQMTPTESTVAPAFIELVLSQLESRVNRARIELGGMLVLTTLDYDLQLRTVCALRTQLAQLGNANEVFQPCAGAESLPPLPSGQKAPEVASAVVLDPRSGQLLALVGGMHNQTEGLNRDAAISLAQHRPGTLLTPFVYLAGFTRGLSPASLVWDLPVDSQDLDVSTGFHRGPLRLRNALTNDSLATATQVFDQMGAALVQQTMAPFGLAIPAANFYALLDTENRYSIIQMAQAYGVFAAQGTLIGLGSARSNQDRLSPAAIISVQSVDGIFQAEWGIPATEQVVSAQLAYLMTDVLSDNLRVSSTSSLGFDFDRPVALKTGQTLNGLDTWAVGYTPYRIAVVWMGGQGVSLRPASGLLATILRSASLGVAPDGWTQPPGMLRLKVCDPSGMLPGEACPNIVNEIFIEGYQPTQVDTLYRLFAINRETGLLATVFTPEQKVEKRIYMMAPPEAQTWAIASNLPVPPTQYDNIQPPSPNPNVNIIFPAMFDELQGRVVIRGTAGGADFSYYRLQYGQGLNPESWTQIGVDNNASVKNGMLAEWDTTNLKGLYSLQLLVIRADNSLQTATVQVSLTRAA